MEVESRETIWKKRKENEWTDKVEIRTKKKFLALGKARVSTF